MERPPSLLCASACLAALFHTNMRCMAFSAVWVWPTSSCHAFSVAIGHEPLLIVARWVQC